MQWLKNGRKIVPDEHTQITVDGCVHTMRIPRSVVEDSAEFTAKIGKAKTAAKLIVEGERARGKVVPKIVTEIVPRIFLAQCLESL